MKLLKVVGLRWTTAEEISVSPKVGEDENGNLELDNGYQKLRLTQEEVNKLHYILSEFIDYQVCEVCGTMMKEDNFTHCKKCGYNPYHV